MPTLALTEAISTPQPTQVLRATSPEARLALDAHGRVLDVNPDLSRLMGLPGRLLPGQRLADACRDHEFLAIIAAGAQDAQPWRTTLRRTGLDGRTRHLLVQALPLAPLASGLMVQVIDATHQVRLQEELLVTLRALASSRHEASFRQAAAGMAYVTLDGRWARINPTLATLLGYREEELLAMPVEAVTHPHDRDTEARTVRQRMLDGELRHATFEKRYLRRDGSEAWVSVTASLARSENGEPSHFIAIVHDIGERKRAEERVRHLGYHDALTGLLNRAGLEDRFEHALAAARANRRRLGVCFVDMDKLKKINDTFGHEEGDRALVGFARRLEQVVRSTDLVARLGGDEFIVVLDDVSTRDDIEASLQRTLLKLARPEPAQGDGLNATCSIGISLFPDDGQDLRTLIHHADLAMYQAKRRGGGGYVFHAASRAPA